MSFILDALRKSENERQETRSAEFASVPSGNDGARTPVWLWLLAALLAINIAVLLGLLLRDVPPTPAAGEVRAADSGVVSDTTLSTRAAAADAAADTRATFSEQVETARDKRAVTVAAESAASPNPAPVTPAAGVARSEQPPPFTLRELPTAAELRANGTLQMAELHLDIHVYSPDPAERFVFINMVRHRERSHLAEGPRVREITPEGVILDYQGTEFLLPRE